MSEVANIQEVQREDDVLETTKATVEEQVVNNSASPVALPKAGDVNANATEASEEAEEPSPKLKTPAKRTPSKRMSFIERAQKESEELVKNMGGSLELEGGRRTRSSTRGTPTRAPVITPPPAKKLKVSPGSAGTPRARGRARKLDVETEGEPEPEPEQVEEEGTPKRRANQEESSGGNAEQSEDDTATVTDSAEERSAVEEKNEVPSSEETVPSVETSSDKVESKLKENAEDAQNHVTEDSQKSVESRKSDSPMNIDENEAEAKEQDPAPASGEKSDTVESKQKSEDQIPASNETVSALRDEKVNDAQSVPAAKEQTIASSVEPMEVDSATEKEKSNVVAVENKVAESNEVKANDTEAPIELTDSDETENGEEQTPSVEAGIALEVKTAEKDVGAKDQLIQAVDRKATENELCEPKLVPSPAIPASNEGAVSTPQYCN